jgi:Flp pilus assembly protein CpaB
MADNRKLIQIVVSGVVALFFVNYYLKSREKSIESGFAMVDVLAASRDIPSRTEIRPDQLMTKRVPERYVEPGAILIKEPGTEYKRVRQKITVAAIPAGGTVILSNLNDPSPETTGVAPIIPQGKRDYSLRLGNVDIQQVILPRDRIDILATLPIVSKAGNSRGTFTILQNVLVLGVDKEFIRPTETAGRRPGSQNGAVLHLSVTPVEAEKLELAVKESDGALAVTVRATNDSELSVLPGIGPDNLMDHPAPQATPPGGVKKRP